MKKKFLGIFLALTLLVSGVFSDAQVFAVAAVDSSPKYVKFEIKHIDAATGEVLDTEKYADVVGDYTTEEKSFDGYILKEKSANHAGKLTDDDEGKTIEVVYQYGKIAKFQIKHIDAATGEVLDTENYADFVGDYTTEEKSFDGYVLKEKSANHAGKLTNADADKTVEVVYQYGKIAKFEIKHIDAATGEVLATEKYADFVGDYTTEEKSFDGYILKEKSANHAGKLTNADADKTVEVVYQYGKIAKFEIKHIDAATGEVLATEKYADFVGDYTTEEKSFDGYILKGKSANHAGKLTNDDAGKTIEVVYQYVRAEEETPDKPTPDKPTPNKPDHPSKPTPSAPDKSNPTTSAKTTKPGSPNQSATNRGSKALPTGDHNDLMLSAAVVVLSMGAVVLLQKKRRMSNN